MSKERYYELLDETRFNCDCGLVIGRKDEGVLSDNFCSDCGMDLRKYNDWKFQEWQELQKLKLKLKKNEH